MPEGVDVSTFQGDLDPEWFEQWDFCIIRAFDRHGDLDARFHRNWSNAAGRTLRGAYGWPKPGADNVALGRMLAAAAADAELGLWADFEHSREYGLATPDELADYLAGCSVRKVGVYSNIPTYPGGVADDLPWWVANYAENDGARHPLSLPAPRDWQIHQYTSAGGPGGSGLDRNYAPTLDLWRSAVRSPIYPEAQWMPGANAGYRAGRTPVSSVVCHYTVGRNSTGIGLQGYYQFQVNRDGTVFQFAEVDAVCWHAGDPWNSRGPGIEVEYLPPQQLPDGTWVENDGDEVWTPPQREAVARLVEWLHDEWGVPYDFYDGPRIAGHRGFITHRSLIQTGDAHNDWWPELPRTTDTTPPEEDDDVKLLPFIIQARGGQWVYDPRSHSAKAFGSEAARDLWVAIFKFDFGHDPAIRADAQAVALLEDAIR